MDVSANAPKVSARRFRAISNLYPPLFFAGVRIEHISDDSTSITVRHRVSRWNKNLNGAAFGGTVYAMTDPFFGLLALRQLGSNYRVWNTRSTIEFIRPGRGVIRTTMRVTPEEVEVIRQTTENGDKSESIIWLRSSRTTALWWLGSSRSSMRAGGIGQ
jgi:acyl-coenzyme A thioesterase PaaI-like protein